MVLFLRRDCEGGVGPVVEVVPAWAAVVLLARPEGAAVVAGLLPPPKAKEGAAVVVGALVDAADEAGWVGPKLNLVAAGGAVAVVDAVVLDEVVAADAPSPPNKFPLVAGAEAAGVALPKIPPLAVDVDAAGAAPPNNDLGASEPLEGVEVAAGVEEGNEKAGFDCVSVADEVAVTPSEKPGVLVAAAAGLLPKRFSPGLWLLAGCDSVVADFCPNRLGAALPELEGAAPKRGAAGFAALFCPNKPPCGAAFDVDDVADSVGLGGLKEKDGVLEVLAAFTAAGAAPNRPPPAAGVLEPAADDAPALGKLNAGFDAASVVALFPPPNRLLAPPVLAPRPGFDGGGPAGVVDGLPPKRLFGAGVVEPAADEAAGFAGVPKLKAFGAEGVVAEALLLF